MKKGSSVQLNYDSRLPSDLSETLLAWYDQSRRILPWREDPTPYHIWVSEIMLQQTRVDTVIPYYKRFLKELPDVRALAEVPEERLLKLWEGLGYYSRARNMQKAAWQIMNEYNGVIPSDPALLQKLSGIGSYTAAAIASIAYQVPVPSVDGNLLRVYARLSCYKEDIRSSAAKKEAEAEFTKVLSADRPGDMNQALMDIGATVCLPNGAPLCEKCPFQSFCLSHLNGLEDEIPLQKEKAKRPAENRTVFLIRQNESVLLHKRPDKGLLAGLYEFPNVTGHLTENKAKKWCRALGLTPLFVATLKPARHIFSHLEWNMTGYSISLDPESGLDNHAGVSEDPAFSFVPVSDLTNRIAIPSAFSAFLKQLMI